ncbi:MAG: hypothetical protein P4L74_02405 [Candidatus Doudnabacteria bacterium]|nr:hypothetical protein [Candidatus Doudnabacteria bacterium]
MTENNLIQNSQNFCKSAEEIITKTGVVEVFSKLGKVEKIGSLRLKLMYRRDIDLFVISDSIEKNKAHQITKELIDKDIFQTIGTADYQNYPAYDMPLGFFWELIIPHEDKNWKFDVWYLKPDESYAHLVRDSINKFEPLLAADPKKAEIILKIKEAYFDGVKYKDNIKSFDIYTAVLENGVKSVEDFEAKGI